MSANNGRAAPAAARALTVRMPHLTEPEFRGRFRRLGEYLVRLSDREFREAGEAILAALAPAGAGEAGPP